MNNILRENEAIKAAKKAAKDAAGAAKAAAAPAVSINAGKKPSGPARKVTKQDSINAAKQAAKAAAGAAKAAGSAAVSVKNESRNRSIIRMTESDLHQIIKESVNRILRETEYDVNSDEWKSNFDLGAEPDWWKGDEAQTNKEIADYDSLPDKARHPYGAEIPDFSGRRDSQKTRAFADYNYGDKLAAKRPNSVFMKQQDKDLDGRSYGKYHSNDYEFKRYLKKRGVDLNTQRLSKDEIDKYWDDYLWDAQHTVHYDERPFYQDSFD